MYKSYGCVGGLLTQWVKTADFPMLVHIMPVCKSLLTAIK